MDTAIRVADSVGNMRIDQADSQIAAMTIELKNQIQQIGQTLTERNQRLDEQQKQLAACRNRYLNWTGLKSIPRPSI